jgi:hypothetical protein
MELEQFITAKRDLEQNLAAAIQAELNKFEEATGRTPIYIDIDMVGIASDDNPRRKFIIESVRTDVPLD